MSAKPQAGTPRRTKEQSSSSTEAQVSVEPQPQPQPPARMVVVTLDDEGNYAVQQQGIDLVSVPTLLKLAAKRVEGQLGV